MLDGTPTYLPNPLAPARVLRTFPGRRMRFVVVLRDPVDRILSNWRHVLWHAPRYEALGQSKHWTTRLAKTPFNDHVERAITQFHACVERHRATRRSLLLWEDCSMLGTDNSLVTISLYDLQLQLWRSMFPASAFCIISSDILRTRYDCPLT